MANWYIEKGPESDVVISSRVRVARNLKNFPFPFKMSDKQGQKVLTSVRDVVLTSEDEMIKSLLFLDLQSITPIDRQVLVEKHLISPDFADSKTKSGALISNDEKISIMINEEDHLRVQSLYPGMQITAAMNLCKRIDEVLEEKIDFAFNDSYGYLTCCPTNIGTGIRASVMLHLPALTMTGYMRSILESCSKLGIAIRGIYGENSEASGNMFQISNQVTLGQAEEEIVNHITNTVTQIIEQERVLRNELYTQNPLRFEDKVYRSLGLFSNARIISSEESLKLISDVRLGVDMGIIENISIETINEIMLLIQPANLQKTVGKPLSSDERDIKRAEIVREKLKTN